jgi:hypothetical protein
MNHTSRIDEDGHGWAPSHDSGADADAGWDTYRNSPQYAIEKEARAVLDIMADALKMPRGDVFNKEDVC